MDDQHENQINIQDLSPRTKVAMGFFLMLVAAGLGFSMYSNPEKLHVPFWVGMVTCGVFFVCGAAVAMHGVVSARVYNAMILVMLMLMGLIPAWIAFGAGERESCTSNIPFLSGEIACRTAFGIAALIMVPVIIIAAKMVICGQNKKN
jgi:hypothetical protein